MNRETIEELMKQGATLEWTTRGKTTLLLAGGTDRVKISAAIAMDLVVQNAVHAAGATKSGDRVFAWGGHAQRIFGK